jgi:hypothetical protein
LEVDMLLIRILYVLRVEETLMTCPLIVPDHQQASIPPPHKQQDSDGKHTCEVLVLRLVEKQCDNSKINS